MINNKKIAAFAIIVLLSSLGGYTLVSNTSEPHPPNPSTTNASFSKAIINTTQSPISAQYSTGSESMLFFHTFTLMGSTATFGFSLNSYDLTTFFIGVGHPFSVSITKTNQSMGFPIFGSFLIKIISSNITTLINENGTETPNSGYTDPGITTAQNSSVVEFHESFTPVYPFTIINSTFAKQNGLKYVKNYSLTYSLEVVPIVEFGPYYLQGSAQWISHSFTYPYSSNTS